MAIAKSWGTEHPILIDLSRYPPDILVDGAVHPVTRVFDIARQVGLNAIPVTGTQINRGPEKDYFVAVSEIIQRDRRGVALRFQYDDIADPLRIKEIVDDTCRRIGADRRNCDAIFDLEAIDRLPVGDEPSESVVELFRSAILALGRNRYRTLAICGSSIPQTVGKKFNIEPCRVDRVELKAWRALNSEAGLQRLLFGDYGIVYAFQSDGGAPIQPPSRIRLSTETEHVLYRSSPNSYRELRTRVAAEEAIATQVDCWGKRSIVGRGSGYTDIGNASKWVAWDTNAHLENTVRSISRELSNVKRFVERASRTRNSVPWLQDELDIVDYQDRTPQ